MPGLFDGHALKHAWVYKYDSAESAQGIAPHADDAAVNVNIWLQDGWQIPETDRGGGGGLKLWLKEVPLSFDFEEYNRKPAELLSWLASDEATDGGSCPVEEMTVSHRVNRAVIFDSSLVHQSDVAGIRPDCKYEDRRMNLTLLFGERR